MAPCLRRSNYVVEVVIIGVLFAIPTAGFICPPETLKAAPVGLPLGSKCGGTCNAAGHCGTGLICKKPKLHGSAVMLLGISQEGICASDDRDDNKRSAGLDLQKLAEHAMDLLNPQMNSMFLFVPIKVLDGKELKTSDNEKKYSVTFRAGPSNCRNDGKHKVADCHAQDEAASQAQTFAVELSEKKGAYTLDKFHPVPNPAEM
eukprot:TRINITY_DN5230_c0_g1_i1.p1 TRINITY_DN5230_c0_g1~~TRINITY_DN5230_c0_g1_i1.p1  ORF type:complete len:224 (+),score=37.04 TRINITY_DN5230_c0_g1_i1:65-673(+)